MELLSKFLIPKQLSRKLLWKNQHQFFPDQKRKDYKNCNNKPNLDSVSKYRIWLLRKWTKKSKEIISKPSHLSTSKKWDKLLKFWTKLQSGIKRSGVLPTWILKLLKNNLRGIGDIAITNPQSWLLPWLPHKHSLENNSICFKVINLNWKTCTKPYLSQDTGADLIFRINENLNLMYLNEL